MSNQRFQLIYDGQCGFCRASLKRLKAIDVFHVIDEVDYHQVPDLKKIHPSLTKEMTEKKMYLLDQKSQLFSGFYAFRHLSLNLPILWLLIPVLYFPGMGIIGAFVYSLIAHNRKYLAFKKSCQNDSCSV